MTKRKSRKGIYLLITLLFLVFAFFMLGVWFLARAVPSVAEMVPSLYGGCNHRNTFQW